MGQLAWDHVLDIRAKLGGVRGNPPSQPAYADDLVCFATENRGLVFLIASSGEEKWQKKLEPTGLIAHHVLAHQHHFLVPIMDARPVHAASVGKVQSWSASGDRLWEHPLANFNVSHLAALGDRLYFCTADKLLHCYDTQQRKEVWASPVAQWSAAAPCVVGDRVFVAAAVTIAGQGVVYCFNAQNGKEIWKNDSFSAASQCGITSHGEAVIIGVGVEQLAALGARDGKVLWQAAVGESGYTSRTTVLADRLYIGGKGYDKNKERVYALFALDSNNGREVWRAASDKHLRVPPLPTPEGILCGSDAGTLYAFDDHGEELWRYSVNSQTEHIRSHLVLAGANVIFGTRNGLIHAVRWQKSVAPDVRQLKPEKLQRQGDLEAAAIVYALQGDLLPSAKLFEELGKVDQAVLVYKEAQAFGDAARLREKQGGLTEALQLYTDANDAASQARLKLNLRDYLGAARLLEQLKKFADAAKAFEDGGDIASAIRLYRQLGKWELAKELAQDKDKVDLMIEMGDILGAAREAVRLGQFVLAADLFHRQEDFANELQALTRHGATIGEWTRVPELARRLGEFEIEAEARVKLGQPKHAAQAYHRAAHQALNYDPPDETRAAKFFERAMTHYRESFDDEKYKECHAKYIRYGRLPWITLQVKPDTHWREVVFNNVNLVIANAGYSLARDIKVEVEGEFDAEDGKNWVEVKGLMEGRHTDPQALHLNLKPRLGHIGKLWLKFTFEFFDESRQHRFSDEHSEAIEVHSKDSQISQSLPIPAMNVSGGTVQVFMEGAKHVAGDEIHSGGQKQVGDRVEVHRVGMSETPRVMVWSEPSQEAGALRQTEADTQPCPHCKLPVKLDDAFCQACGNKL